MSRAPTILNFDLQEALDDPAARRPGGAVAVGKIPAGVTIWSHHFAFERGRLFLTVIGAQGERP